MPKYFAGVALPPGVDSVPKDRFEEFRDFTREETRALKLKRGLPLYLEHDRSQKIGEVLHSFDYPSGAKGVVGVIDDTPAGAAYAKDHLFRSGGALGLSLGHGQKKIAKKAGDLSERGDRRFERDGHSITKRQDHLAVVQTPARDGCRILTWFDAAAYKEGDPEAFLKRIAEERTPEGLERMSSDSTKQMSEEQAKLAAMSKEDLEKLALQMQRDFDASRGELQSKLDGAQKGAQEAKYLRELMKEQFHTKIDKLFGNFSQSLGQSEETAQALRENFHKAMNPWNPAEGEAQLNRPKLAEDVIETMVEASLSQINALKSEIASLKNRPLTEEDVPVVPTKRPRMEEPPSVDSRNSALLERLQKFYER